MAAPGISRSRRKICLQPSYEHEMHSLWHIQTVDWGKNSSELGKACVTCLKGHEIHVRMEIPQLKTGPASKNRYPATKNLIQQLKIREQKATSLCYKHH
jgi:hypothetical protein